ncbi:MAG: flagellar motor protein, partial [Pseudomonadota bacterium]
ADLLSIGGLLVAVGAIALAQYFEGGHFGMLINFPAMLIVVGGSIGATMLQSPLPIFMRALILSKSVLSAPQFDSQRVAKDLIAWGRVARKDGLLGLEKLVGRVPDELAQKGLKMMIDGCEPEVIQETLELDALTQERRDLQAVRVFDGMGGYAPTLGILGAVLGLIHVMNNLSEPALLGEGIAVAFVATIYGVGFANLVFIPVANKLRAVVSRRTEFSELITVGIVAIANGENPRVIEARITGLL